MAMNVLITGGARGIGAGIVRQLAQNGHNVAFCGRKDAPEFHELAEKTALLRTALGGKHEEILAAMAELRKVVDALEREVDDARWPLPKYREMLFVY